MGQCKSKPGAAHSPVPSALAGESEKWPPVPGWREDVTNDGRPFWVSVHGESFEAAVACILAAVGVIARSTRECVCMFPHALTAAHGAQGNEHAVHIVSIT